MTSRDQDALESAREKVFRALGHSLRRQSLAALTRERGSAKTLADQFGMPIGNLQYHLKVLEECGVIERVKKVKRRGATEHLFAIDAKAFRGVMPWAEIPEPVWNLLRGYGLEEFLYLLNQQLENEARGARDKSWLEWAPIELDHQGQLELFTALGELRAASDRAAKNTRRRQRRLRAPDVFTVITGSAAFKLDVDAGPRPPGQ